MKGLIIPYKEGNMNEITKLVEEAVESSIRKGDKPAVLLSGGLDSTITLHHLAQKFPKGSIHTYTAVFNSDQDENKVAKEVSEFYGTVHKEVDVTKVYERMPEIMKGLDKPRFNAWPFLLIEQAAKDGCNVLFIGEGSDEHFGGYAAKDYLEGWADHIRFILPLYRQFCDRFDMRFEAPFDRLNWQTTRKWHENPQKIYLRRAHKDLIPDVVFNKVKSPPAFTDYWNTWEKELKPLLPEYEAKTLDDVRKAMMIIAAEAWLKANK